MGTITLFFLRVVVWAYALQPAALRRFWGNALGWSFRVLGIRTAVVRTNLSYAFPPDGTPENEAKRERLFRAAYSHLGNLTLEAFMLLGPMPRFLRDNAELIGVEHYREAVARGKGAIMLSSHLGNWEIMAAGGALHGKIPIMLVTKQLKPAWLHEAIERGRAACGVTATYEPRTLRDVLSHLKKNRAVGFVLDQYAGPPVGVRVPVFGIPVGTMTAIAAVAKRTEAAVLPVMSCRLPNGRFRIEIRPPLEWEPDPDPGYELALNTARYAAFLEKDIYAHPDQWHWTHRRFKGDLSPLKPDEWRSGRARR